MLSRNKKMNMLCKGHCDSSWMNKNLIVLFAIILLSSVCATYIQTPSNYGTGNLNFNWTYLYYYGDQQSSSSSLIIDSPYDFILSQDNSSLFVSDYSAQQIKKFIKSSVGNFTVLPSANGLFLSVVQRGQDSFAFGSSSLVQLYNGSQLTNLSFISSFSNVHGLCYDGLSTLYVADSLHSRVVAVNISNGQLIRLYGKTNISDLSENTNATIESMGRPYRLRLDCAGNLWVMDMLFMRIVRYRAGTTTADLVWGQSSWTSFIAQTTQNGFYYPTDIVFDATCSVAFVADYNRVLLFRAPFVSNQAAEGVLGASNFTTEGSFGNITRLQLEETGNNGLLYILDQDYKRIVVGTTQWNKPSSFNCSTSSAVEGECLIQQAVTLEGLVITVPENYTRIVIGGSLTMNNNTQVRINSQQQIQSSGDVALAGQLTIFLTARDSAILQQNGTLDITPFTTNSTMRGAFSAVTIEGDTSECGVTKEEEYTGRSMRAVITRVQECGELEGDESLSSGALAGILIGALCGLYIAMIGGAIIGILNWGAKPKKSTGRRRNVPDIIIPE